MIKRVHYKVDHGDQSGGSSSDSSSSDSGTESDADAPARPKEQVSESESESESGGEQAVTVETNPESDDEDKVEEEVFYQKQPSLPSPGSGYESEESSGNEVDEDSPGLVADMEEEKETKPIKKHKKGGIVKADAAKENSTGIEELDSCILKSKSVFRCKLCPRIICLSEKIVKQHLESKRHARSKKLFEGGRLKVMLNSDGELEEDYETHAERYARTLALAEEGPHVPKKDTGRQRQRLRRKKRAKNAATEKTEQHTGSSKKKKQKREK
ncbi:histone-lysine N-methyltransferase SETD1B isoform X1 [Carex littledalei]|uniref:Histone-lysine N-methyltransferase SETD1B isoform X1 n=1 Tax=Carex littledalei TaxID=544730 RepID=A0A833R062_9POAL|nr:histone-lysine N-methyltransferase SETD1B isoform X1 [Carex littledalei]